MSHFVRSFTGAGVTSEAVGSLRLSSTFNCGMIFCGRERRLHGQVLVAPKGAKAPITAASGRFVVHRADYLGNDAVFSKGDTSGKCSDAVSGRVCLPCFQPSGN